MLENVAQYQFVAKPQPTFYFIGVTTTKSSIMKIFPLWTRELGHPEIVIEGVDLKLHDTVEAFRQAVTQIKYDPNSLGALVTAHKISLYEAVHDLFNYLDPYAQICGEVSSISKRDGTVEWHAKDPISSGLSLDAIMEQMPPASIIINATGMGKDLPGSPITDQGIFPENAIAWELNYRGKLGFMHQARAQSEARQVRVEDGWLYFLHGWTQAIAQVYQLEIVGDLFDRLAAIAGGIAR